jgi:hypothetical protein
MGAFFAGEWLKHHSYEISGAIATEVGSALFVSVVLGIFWDAFGKRAYADELLEKAGIAQSINTAGIRRFTFFRSPELSWNDLFNKTNKLDIFVVHASTWRNTHVDEIINMLEDKKASLRIVLPDPDNERVIGELASRFVMDELEVQNKIREAASFFSERRTKARGTVEVRFTTQTPLYSYYIFSTGGIFAFFNHKAGKEEPVPALQCDNHGTFYRYLAKQFEELYTNARTSVVDEFTDQPLS